MQVIRYIATMTDSAKLARLERDTPRSSGTPSTPNVSHTASSPNGLYTHSQPDTTLCYLVNGMDCASCVKKVEQAVSRLAGVDAVKVSFNRQTLELQLDETKTQRSTLENSLRSLGYSPTLQTAAPADAPTTDTEIKANTTQHSPAKPLPWYQTRQGQRLVNNGVLLLIAYLFSFVEPRYATCGYIIATLFGVWPLAKKALASARFGDPFSINMLVSLAALGALLIGEAAEGAAVVLFFAVGELLESVAAGRARAGIQALAALTPKTALLVVDSAANAASNSSTYSPVRQVPADSLEVGQVVQINSGARVPADGRIIAGSSSLDDSPVTGESMPIYKTVGSTVYAGSINGAGVLKVAIEKKSADNTIARIIQMVEEAESNKAPTARFIDRFSRWYTPSVIVVALLVAVIPPLFLAQTWQLWLYKGLALLLIGCPCALVLSVPAAITSAISAGTRRGLLIKGGAALESMGNVKTVAFDKTGTLTAGKPRVTDVLGTDHSDTQEVLRLAAAIETGSSHPLAKAIVNEATDRQLTPANVSDAQTLPGQGVSAVVEGHRLFVSSPSYAATHCQITPTLQQASTNFEQQGKTAVILHDETQALGLIAMRDEPRADAVAAISRLKQLGVQTIMLTGDNARTAQAIANKLDIDVQAELLPADKLQLVERLQANGGVIMVGDGINDAPALARANVGVAMGSGTDVALETANAALLHEKVAGVAQLLQLSRDALTNIKQNIAFALGLKAIFLITTLFGHTNLWMAILADTGATAIVTANALRLLRWQDKGHGEQAQSISSASPIRPSSSHRI